MNFIGFCHGSTRLIFGDIYRLIEPYIRGKVWKTISESCPCDHARLAELGMIEMCSGQDANLRQWQERLMLSGCTASFFSRYYGDPHEPTPRIIELE